MELRAVNQAINALPAIADAALYGRADFWEVIGARGGDCEDFALGKQAELARRGWPPESLRLATCWTEDGEYHAVLTVDCRGQTWVLDNRYPDIEPFQALPYRWDKRQAPAGASWVQIGEPA
jgi:predicted transglutaminase-like cysteine proteinase